MSVPLSIAVYFTMWWIVLFAVLPFGVKAQHEAGAADDRPPAPIPGAGRADAGAQGAVDDGDLGAAFRRA